jgi:hypothetical protein
LGRQSYSDTRCLATENHSSQPIALPCPNASCLPILPKHTQLQNNTLAIQVPTPILSCEMRLSIPTPGAVMFASVNFGGCIAGDGTMSGLIPNNTNVPAIPTTVERMKPGFDRSIRYHSTGFTSARVNETCSVDCQGNRLYTTTIRNAQVISSCDSRLQKLSPQKPRCCAPQESNRPRILVDHHHHHHRPKKWSPSSEWDYAVVH